MSLSILDRPTTDPTHLYRYRDGLYAVDLLTAAIVHFDLFSYLRDHPGTLDDVCEGLKVARRPADVLITLAAANGLVERRDDVISITDLAREHLTTGSAFNLGAYYASLKDRPVVQDFVRVLQTGKPAHWGGGKAGHDWHASMEQEAFARSFTAAMDCRGALLGNALASSLDVSRYRRLLDVGGGSGIYACIMAALHPHLTATVFDQPPVDRIAATLIAERGFADRVSVLAGSFFEDDWPAGYDAHLFSNVLHDWDEAEVLALLRRSYAALPPGGLLLIHDAFIDEDKTGPLPVAEYSAILMHSTQGKCYSVVEYDDMLSRAGFRDAGYWPTACDRGVMTAHKRA